MISNKCNYALRAMLELALCEGEGPITIGDIAGKQRIPVRFLEAILRQLKLARLADSARGKDGGYFLSTPARNISVGSVIRLFEGSLVSVNPMTIPNKKRGDATDVFQEMWDQAEQSLSAVFDKVTFASLAEQEKNRQLAHIVNYSI
ncbi:MAG: Rrf2 family transcriptional regulator [bacterium]